MPTDNTDCIIQVVFIILCKALQPFQHMQCECVLWPNYKLVETIANFYNWKEAEKNFNDLWITSPAFFIPSTINMKYVFWQWHYKS